MSARTLLLILAGIIVLGIINAPATMASATEGLTDRLSVAGSSLAVFLDRLAQ